MPAYFHTELSLGASVRFRQIPRLFRQETMIWTRARPVRPLTLNHLHIQGPIKYSDAQGIHDKLVRKFLDCKKEGKETPDPVLLTFQMQPVYTMGRRQGKEDALLETPTTERRNPSRPMNQLMFPRPISHTPCEAEKPPFMGRVRLSHTPFWIYCNSERLTMTALTRP